MEILIHPGYGGFSFSDSTVALYQERTGKEADTYSHDLRTDPTMISIVKELGKKENPDLVIKTIRPGYESFYKIDEYDGAESIQYDEAAYALYQLLKNTTMSESARIAAAIALLEG
jgi:hypothetical protein